MAGIGSPGQESFERAILKVRNQHIAVGLTPLIVFRQEITTNDEFKSRAGIDNTTRDHFTRHLVNSDRIRRHVTYNPDDTDLKQLLDKSTDTKEAITAGEKPAGGDEVQGQSGREFYLPWALDGSDPNIPMLSALQMNSPNGIILVNAVDQAIVTWTRLESRHRTKWITVMDSMRVYGVYQQMLAFLVAFAGDENAVDVANPLATDEPLGPQSSPNRRGEISGPGAAAN